MKKLKQELSELDIWALALGAIIGWGCFVLPGNKFLPEAGPVGTIIALTIGALIMIIIAKSYGLLISRFTNAGGEYTYAYVGFGRVHAFVAAWMLGLSYLTIVPLNATALGLVGRFMFPGLLQQGYLYTVAGWDVYLGELLVSLSTLVLFTYLNVRGVKLFGQLAKVLAFGLTGGVIVLFIMTLFYTGFSFSNLSPAFSPTKDATAGILSIIAIAPWAYVGFDTIPQASEEFKFSPKKSYRLMVIAIIIGALMYMLTNTFTAMVYPWADFIASKPHWATGDAVQAVAGNLGMFLLGIAILSAILSGINGFLMASSRLFLAMARTKSLPKLFANIHETYQTPDMALWFVMGVSLLAPFFGRAALLWIVDMASIGAAVGYFYTSAAPLMMWLKHKDPKDTELKKLLPYSVLGSLFSLGFIVLLLYPGSPAVLGKESLIALVVWIALGIVFYLRSTAYRKASQAELDNVFGVR